MMGQPPANEGTAHAGPDADRLRLHARQRRRVWLPFGAGLALFVVVLGAAAAAIGPHVGVLANLIVITFCLIPMALLTLAIFLAISLAITGVSRLDVAAVRQTARAEDAAADITLRTRDTARTVGKQMIGLSAAVERLAPLWDIFDVDETKGNGDAAQRTADD